MQKEIKDIIEREYRNLVDLDIIVRQKSEEVNKNKLSILESDVEDIEEISKLYSDKYVDLVLFGRDLKTIFDRIHYTISLYNELGYSGLSEEVVKFYNDSSMNSPKQIFFIKDGKLMEKEEGSLQKERDLFLKSDFMKNLQGGN